MIFNFNENGLSFSMCCVHESFIIIEINMLSLSVTKSLMFIVVDASGAKPEGD